MNFAQLRAFHAVASEGGFTRGAERLGISQPAVTMQVRALEQAQGVELFSRRGQRVELTEFGREVWQHARRIFAQLHDLDELLAAAGSLRTGSLTIGADGPFSVMDPVAAFIARHPGVRVAVRIGNAARVVADLEEGRTDLAILNLIGARREIHHEPLYRDEIVAFVVAGHPLADRPGIGLEALAAAPLILREPGSATRALLLDALAARGLEPTIALELGSREAVREAVLAGLGVGAVFARELVPDPRLVALPIAGGKLAAEVALACLPERRDLRAVQAFFAIAAQCFGSGGQGHRTGGARPRRGP
jgi:aminoethylphosphonate catabolism LysR family transcriptional regulator